MLYKLDRRYDAILSYLLAVGIREVINGGYYSVAIFNNGVKYEYWDTNKYYAWLNKTEFTLPNGKKEIFNEVSVKRRTMRKFRKELSKVLL